MDIKKEFKNAQKCLKGNTEPLGLRSRNWCFTSFDEIAPEFNSGMMTYLCIGKEICPTSKNEHWQGFVCLKDKKSLKQVKLLIGEKPHLESIRGTLAQNVKYCKKDGSYEEFGVLPTQGARTDLNVLKERIFEGEKVNTLVEENPMWNHTFGRTMDRLEDIAMKKRWRTEPTKGYWYVGKTGTGKSHAAFNHVEYHPDRVYVVPNDGDWWDGYEQQDVVIMNDFRGKVSYNELLQMVDKWPYHVRRRGRMPIPFISKVIIITSSLMPEKVYHNRDREDDIEQLKRRFEIICLD